MNPWRSDEIATVLLRMLEKHGVSKQLGIADCRDLALDMTRDVMAIRRKSWDIVRIARGDFGNKGGVATRRLVQHFASTGSLPGAIDGLNQTSGFVYVMTSSLLPDGVCKIGLSTDTKRRLKQFRTGLPRAVMVYQFETDNCARDEKRLQNLLAHKHFELEWYHSLSRAEIEDAWNALKSIIDTEE